MVNRDEYEYNLLSNILCSHLTISAKIWDHDPARGRTVQADKYLLLCQNHVKISTCRIPSAFPENDNWARPAQNDFWLGVSSKYFTCSWTNHWWIKGLSARKKVIIQSLTHQSKLAPRTPITMLTAYDYPTGWACETYGIKITLVGDSLTQVCLRYNSTTRLTMSKIIHHCRAVSRGSKTPFLVADMLFGSYHTNTNVIRSAITLVRDGRVEGVKLEGG